MNALPLLVILLPLGAAAVAHLSRPGSRTAPRAVYLLNACGFGFALVLLVASIGSDPGGLVLSPGGSDVWFGISADRLGALLLVMICGVSTIVQAFAGRYLYGDVRQRRFFVAANLLTGATALMVTSVTLVGFAVGWSLAGASLVLLLRMYPGVAAADDGARRTALAFLVGDGALWVAVIVATLTWGNLDLRQMSGAGLESAGDGIPLALVACLTVMAALSRSGQIPFHNWLPMTVAVPTPVSALLHAGVVNAGGILLVRMSPVFGASSLATHVAFIAGASTAVYGTALMLTKPDVKGALAHSTMGQMGFMIMTCGIGAWAAAIIHLVAHGMFKSSLFLGSGSAVKSGLDSRKAPPLRGTRPARKLLAGAMSVLVPGGAIIVSIRIFYPEPDSASVALLIFAWATAAWSLWGWSIRKPGPGGILAGSIAISAAIVAYVLMVRVAGAFLAPDLADAGTATLGPAWVAALVGAIALTGLIRFRPGGTLLSSLHKNLYVGALAASQSSVTRRRSLSWQPAGRTRSPGRLMPRSQGVRT